MGLKDIRELRDDKQAYAAELERRWSGLLSYRYIGRRYGDMDVGEGIDNTVKVRRDFRNSTAGCWWRPSPSARPRAAASRISKRCRTRSSTAHSSSTRAAT